MILVSKDVIETTAKIVRNNRLPNCMRKLSQHGLYNCWGFTAFALQLVDTLCWVDRLHMDEILKKYTRPIHIEDRHKGDIVVYRAKNLYGERNYLLHTAIIVDSEFDIMIHKDGDEPLETANINKTYYHNRHRNLQVTYRRIK